MKLTFDMVFWWTKSALLSGGQGKPAVKDVNLARTWRLLWKSHQKWWEASGATKSVHHYSRAEDQPALWPSTLRVLFWVWWFWPCLNNQAGTMLGVCFSLHDSGPFPKSRHVIFWPYVIWFLNCLVAFLLCKRLLLPKRLLLFPRD